MHKYGAKSIVIDGHKFPSLSEGRRYTFLKGLEKRGVITNLVLQPAYKFTVDGRKVVTRSKGFPNGRHVTCRFDFSYFCTKRNCMVIEDVKSSATKTTAYKLRKAFYEAFNPGVHVIEVEA